MFNDLPSLFLIEVFKYTSLEDRLNCSRVCQNWRAIAASFNQKSLFCYFDFYPNNLKWSYTNDLVGFRNSIQIESFDFLQHKLTILLFEEIKKLIVFNLNKTCIKQFERYIGHFKKLEQLELNGLDFEGKSVFDFPKLKILTLKDVSLNTSNYTIALITPELEVLVCWKKIYNLIFCHEPSNLKYLECLNEVANFKFNRKFTSLEVMNFFDVTGSINEDFLNDFPNLKIMNLYNNFSMDDLERFENQKQRFGLKDLRILFMGFEDIYVKPTIGLNFTNMLQRANIKCLVENYSKLNQAVPWSSYCDFLELINQFEDIPKCFFKKYIHIQTVHVAKVKDHMKLIDFLNQCGYIPHLRIAYSQLEQEFFDKLESISIATLEITDEDIVGIRDFKFLSNLKIFILKIKLDYLPTELVRNVLSNKSLKYFNYKKNLLNVSIKLDKKEKLIYLEIDYKLINKFTSDNDVLCFLKKEKKTRGLVI